MAPRASRVEARRVEVFIASISRGPVGGVKTRGSRIRRTKEAGFGLEFDAREWSLKP
jgi:hypothetical protein